MVYVYSASHLTGSSNSPHMETYRAECNPYHHYRVACAALCTWGTMIQLLLPRRAHNYLPHYVGAKRDVESVSFGQGVLSMSMMYT